MNDPSIARGAVALASGSLFGLGLTLSRMTRVERVRGFLDFAGRWDPSLLFVMGGALLVHALAWQIVARRSAPVFAPRFEVTTARAIDGRLLGGAAVFGVGWGLGGFCPGPAVVSLASGSPAAGAFVAALLAGFALAGAAGDGRPAEARAGSRLSEAPPEPPATA